MDCRLSSFTITLKHDTEMCIRDRQSTWQELGQSFPGYNSDTLTISLTNNYRLTNSYRCKLVGADGNVKYTDIVKIEKAKPVTITSQPVSTVGKIEMCIRDR